MKYCTERVNKGSSEFFIVHQLDCSSCKTNGKQEVGEFRNPVDALQVVRRKNLDSYCCFYCCRGRETPVSRDAAS